MVFFLCSSFFQCRKLGLEVGWLKITDLPKRINARGQGAFKDVKYREKVDDEKYDGEAHSC